MPSVALLGPRQVGNTTLALTLSSEYIDKPFIDLELESDLAKLSDPEGYFDHDINHLIIIDEVQLKPEIFKTLRGIIDKRKRTGEKSAQFLLLGSASKDLLQQSSETLAERIRYLELTPFLASEVFKDNPMDFKMERLWLRGGFPDSYLAQDDQESWQRRSDFIVTYVERDIPNLGINVSNLRMRRFWSMLAHYHGQQINMSSLAKSLEVSHTTIRDYLDILTDLYMVRQVQPWSGNTKKRLIKSPKIYIRDTGLLHRLLSIPAFEDLLGHPVIGASWEGFVIESILSNISDQWTASYYRSAEQTKIDLILERSMTRYAIEIKRTSAPRVPSGFLRACEDIKATNKFIIHAGTDRFPLSNQTEAIGLIEFLKIFE